MKKVILTNVLALIFGFVIAQNVEIHSKELPNKQRSEQILGKLGDKHVGINLIEDGLITSHLQVIMLDQRMNMYQGVELDKVDYFEYSKAWLVGEQVLITTINSKTGEFELTKVACKPKMRTVSERTVFYEIPKKLRQHEGLVSKAISELLNSNFTRRFYRSENGEYYHLDLSIRNGTDMWMLSVLFDKDFKVINETYHNYGLPKGGDIFYYNSVVSNDGKVTYVLNMARGILSDKISGMKPGIAAYVISKDGKGTLQQITTDDSKDDYRHTQKVLSHIKGNKVYVGGYKYNGILHGVFDLSKAPSTWELNLEKYDDDMYARYWTYDAAKYNKQLSKAKGKSIFFFVETSDIQVNEDGAVVISGQAKEYQDVEGGVDMVIYQNVFVSRISENKVDFTKIAHTYYRTGDYYIGGMHTTIANGDEIVLILNAAKSSKIGGYKAKVVEGESKKGGVFRIAKDGSWTQYPYPAEGDLWSLHNSDWYKAENEVLLPAITANKKNSGYLKIEL